MSAGSCKPSVRAVLRVERAREALNARALSLRVAPESLPRIRLRPRTAPSPTRRPLRRSPRVARRSRSPATAQSSLVRRSPRPEDPPPALDRFPIRGLQRLNPPADGRPPLRSQPKQFQLLLQRLTKRLALLSSCSGQTPSHCLDRRGSTSPDASTTRTREVSRLTCSTRSSGVRASAASFRRNPVKGGDGLTATKVG